MKHNKRGFTLIELLVVVLIIGILSAIAIPQYQKAVEKAKATQALTLLKSIQTAENAYFLANGTYAINDWSLLDVQIDWPDSTKKWWEGGKIPKTNGEWVLEIFQWGTTSIVMGRIEGNHQGGAFILPLIPFPGTDKISANQIYCAEKRCCGTVYRGTGYCEKIFGGTKIYSDGGEDWYSLP
ncbi:MAG: prepilin-type N-terminal cleavage/methylation domain-containing protein [Elusimicrobiaceae bacterium]|nr:prepilin-type N-terminal cleavage/methylation domain-containing protein [Elusimicrobiaceae bacterium]